MFPLRATIVIAISQRETNYFPCFKRDRSRRAIVIKAIVINIKSDFPDYFVGIITITLPDT
jgi:hypothetical protein